MKFLILFFTFCFLLGCDLLSEKDQSKLTACRPFKECLIKKELQVSSPKDRKKQFSKDNKAIYYSGVKQSFDPQSFQAFEVENCSLHTDAFTKDKDDIYIASPQSCGASCGKDYTGYYWAPLGLQAPSEFTFLGGGYGLDKDRIVYVYQSWNGAKSLKDVNIDMKSFEVLICGSKDKEEIIARDRFHYFKDGKTVSPDEVFKRWQ